MNKDVAGKKHMVMNGEKKKGQVDVEGFPRVIRGRRVIGPSFEDFTDGQKFSNYFGNSHRVANFLFGQVRTFKKITSLPLPLFCKSQDILTLKKKKTQSWYQGQPVY